VDGRFTTAGARRRFAAGVVTALAALVLPLAGAGQAGAADRAAEPVGTVTQDGPPPVLVNGSPTGATLDFTVTLPASVHGAVNARLDLPFLQFSDSGHDDPLYLIGVLHGSCRVDGGAATPCPWHSPGEFDDDAIMLHLPATQAKTSIHYSAVITADAHFLDADQPISGSVQVTGEDGTVLAKGGFGLQFHYVIPDQDKVALYARDAAGVLWKYDGTGNPAAAFRPRVRVGGGWQIYTAITPLWDNTIVGVGDLVARDKAGVLWYYRGSGDRAHPFLPRVRVGSGWNIYTAIVAGGWITTPGHSGIRHSLIGRDAAGKIWLYAATGDMNHPFTARVQAGHGWNIYNPLIHFSGGVAGRDSAGALWAYDGSGSAPSSPFGPRVRVGTGWNMYSALAGIGDANNDAYPDLVARDKTGGLWLYTSSTTYPSLPSTRYAVGPGWNIYNLIF
jgi:hypothetical protein